MILCFEIKMKTKFETGDNKNCATLWYKNFQNCPIKMNETDYKIKYESIKIVLR